MAAIGEADVGEALAEGDVLVALDMALIPEEHDLAVHQGAPDAVHLGVGGTRHVHAVDDGADARRERFDREFGVGVPPRGGVAFAQPDGHLGGVVLVGRHATCVRIGAAGWVLPVVPEPGISPSTDPPVGSASAPTWVVQTPWFEECRRCGIVAVAVVHVSCLPFSR